MTGFSHLSSGAIIGLTVTNPWLAVPLAFVSHLLFDTFPHYGEDSRFDAVNERRWLAVTILDGVMMVALLLFLLLNGRAEVAVIGLVAMSPDIPFIAEIIRQRLFKIEKNVENRSVFTKFHSRIQRLERPRGWILELGYATVFATILFNLL